MVSLFLLKTFLYSPIPCDSFALLPASTFNYQVDSSPQQTVQHTVPESLTGFIEPHAQDKIKRQADNDRLVDHSNQFADNNEYSRGKYDEFTPHTPDIFQVSIELAFSFSRLVTNDPFVPDDLTVFFFYSNHCIESTILNR